MPGQELKLKQASAVLNIAPKDLQNFVQAGVLRPRRRGNVRYFDREQLLSAKVALFLKASLGSSTRYLSKFTRAVAAVPGFASGGPETVRVRSGPPGGEHVSILIPVRLLAVELDERLPLAEHLKDRPRGRKRAGWEDGLRKAFSDGAKDLAGVTSAQLLQTIRDVRRARRRAEPTVVAEAVETTAQRRR